LFSNWYFYFLLVLIILNIPKLNLYFSALHTMFHEMGHAIVCLLFQGRVERISLFPNTEGEIVTATGSWIARVFTSYAGYTFTPLVAYLCYYMINEQMYIALLYGFMAVAVTNLILWVRNFYGIVWLTSFIGLCFLIHYINNHLLVEGFVQFLGALLVVDSVKSAFIICVLSIRDRKHAGDATNLAKSTFIPAFIWGTLFLGQSLLMTFIIFHSFIR
jgi:hypothetical protein